MNYISIDNKYFNETCYLRISSPLRIGLFGGSFNPVHDGHIYISNQARIKLKLDLVLWLVTPENPLKKNNKKLLSFEQRLTLCKTKTNHLHFIKIIGIENSFNLRYSYLILKKLSSLTNEHNKLFWIMGEDNLENIYKFKQWRDIVNNYNCAIFARGESSFKTLSKKHSFLNQHNKVKFYLIPKNTSSSSQIRRKYNQNNK